VIEPRNKYSRGPSVDNLCLCEGKPTASIDRKAAVPKEQARCSGHHRGLRAGHVSKGVTRELRRATESPCVGTGVGVPTVEVKTPGAERELEPQKRAYCENKRDTKLHEQRKESGKERENRTSPRGALGSLSVS
jgi:hypothetical protein